jgi:hypothetical protein
MSDQQAVDPVAALRTRAANLDKTIDGVRSAASLSSITSSLAEIDSQLSSLPGELVKVRSRGYAFKSYLEADVDAVRLDWPSVRLRVDMATDAQRRELAPQVDDLQARSIQAAALIGSDLAQADAALTSVEGEAHGLEDKANTAASSLRGMYDDLQSRLNKTKSDLQHAGRVLDHIDAASFKLYPEENAIDAIEGQMIADQKGGPKGMLYCTDHRLLFEQNEEVATKRVLFVVTERQKVQKLLLEAPIGKVKQVKESESGALLLRRDHLELTFAPGVPVSSAHFITKGDSAAWQRLINQVTSGDIEKERVTPEGTQPADKPKAMPSKCPACGAQITETLVRGMQSVKCRYCGTVIPF